MAITASVERTDLGCSLWLVISARHHEKEEL